MSIFKRQDPTKLQEQVKALKGSSGFQKDEKEWKLTMDAQKNGSAVIRFLPARSDDELAFVRLVNHSFKRNNKWFIHNCPSTHGNYPECPVCQHISDNDLFDKAKANKNGPEDKLLGQIGRKQSFWANILVIKDAANPDNVGKVFKFRMGKKIMDKIEREIQGDEEIDKAGIAVTCPFGGANFNLKSKKQGDYPNYEDSSFLAPSQIANIEDEAVQKAIFEGMSDLRPIIAPDQFKSKDELTKKFTEVMGTSVSAVAASAAASLEGELENLDFDEQLDQFDSKPSKSTGVGTAEVNQPKQVVSESPKSTSGDTDLDDLLNFD